MRKNKKKQLSFQKIDTQIQAFLHSHNFRKVALLVFIAAVLFLNLAILGLHVKDMKSAYLPTARIINPWEKDVRSIVKDTPMEIMAPYISQKEKKTAAFLVSIAKKESNLGKYSPRLGEKNCWNFWGYRGHVGQITPSGYTCFDNPRQAVSVVGNRISHLINESKLTTPRKMAVWKCGYDCSWDNPVAVEKWIQDVDYYYQKFYD